jgi:hypothetical protein
MGTAGNTAHREPWNKGKIVGQKAPFKLKDIWALRVRFQMEHRVRELALFNLGIDSKLRGCERDQRGGCPSWVDMSPPLCAEAAVRGASPRHCASGGGCTSTS